MDYSIIRMQLLEREKRIKDGHEINNGEGRDKESDVEATYQSMAVVDENTMLFETESLDEKGELIGYVEEIEGTFPLI